MRKRRRWPLSSHRWWRRRTARRTSTRSTAKGMAGAQTPYHTIPIRSRCTRCSSSTRSPATARPSARSEDPRMAPRARPRLQHHLRGRDRGRCSRSRRIPPGATGGGGVGPLADGRAAAPERRRARHGRHDRRRSLRTPPARVSDGGSLPRSGSRSRTAGSRPVIRSRTATIARSRTWCATSVSNMASSTRRAGATHRGGTATRSQTTTRRAASRRWSSSVEIRR